MGTTKDHTTLWLPAAPGNKKHHIVLIVARNTISQINKYLMSNTQAQKCSHMNNLANTSGHHTTKEFENWFTFKITLVYDCKAINIQSDSTRPLYCNGHVQLRAIRVHTMLSDSKWTTHAADHKHMCQQYMFIRTIQLEYDVIEVHCYGVAERLILEQARSRTVIDM